MNQAIQKVYHPYFYLRGMLLDSEDRRRVVRSFGIGLTMQGDEGVDPILPGRLKDILENPKGEFIQYWPHINIDERTTREMCEIASVWTNRNSNKTDYRIAKINKLGFRNIGIRGIDAVIVFVTPYEGGFEIQIYKPRVHMYAGVLLPKALTGRNYVVSFWATGLNDDDLDLGEDYEYLSGIVEKLLELCSENVRISLVERNKNRRLISSWDGKQLSPAFHKPSPVAPSAYTDADNIPFMAGFRWIWRKVPFVPHL